MYKIEKNIPIPKKVKEQLPFDQMEVGDSFFLPDLKIKQLSFYARSFAKVSGKKFAIRPEENGSRCWRIK